MGLCGSSQALSPEEQEKAKADAAATKAIDSEQAKAKQESEKFIKLLLLGAGESGKSTLFKQMLTIYGKGFSEQDRLAYVKIIHGNVITSMKTLVEQGKLRDLAPAAELADDVQLVEGLASTDVVDVKVADACKRLWADPNIQATFMQRSSFPLFDSAPYFFERLDDLGQAAYVPTEQDVLRSRAPTSGIVENEFHIDGQRFRMFDVGGQRNERKKWIHCFEGVTAVLFVAALSEYDQMLFEDDTQNRMLEAIEIFDEICNSRWFTKTAMILFLNKRDLLAEKVARVPLKNYLKDYDGPDEFEPVAQFIQQKFVEKNKKPSKPVYCHITCATDTGNVRAVFNAVRDVLNRNALDESGLGLA